METFSNLADSHAHLNNPDFANDLDEVAGALGGMLVLNAAYDVASSLKGIEIARKYPNMYASVGIHPNDTGKATEADFKKLAELAKDEKVVAIGETGLDYYRNRAGAETQKKWLRLHLGLAAELNKPVIIHCREAWADILPILRDEAKSGGVLHCFSEGPDEALEGQRLGWHVSFAGNATYPKAEKLRLAAKAVRSEYLLMETDCPYLSPQSVRGKRNDPRNLVETAKTLAQTRGLTYEDTVRITRMNFEKLFLDKRPEKGEIVYWIRNSLYVNVSRACNNRCVFCPREENPVVQGHYLGLARDPEAREIISAVGDSRPDEIVLCGFGEPTIRLDVVKEVASAMKQKGLKVRLNTNGQGSLINGRDIVPELKGLVDVASVSLNADNAETYNKICLPADPANAFKAVCDFITRSRDVLPDTVASAVAYPPDVDVEKVKKFAEETLKVRFRTRMLDLVG
ncbi:MAG: YchF/TatD family DNA exonuclease [Nitrospinae bacterium]|nr:YchF/TatD family DNA exonuclease [Nitrospinota bacterium]